MSGSQSLDRGLAILGLLDASAEPLGVREIARQLAISPAIVQRLINSLASRDYVERNPITKRYGIGYRALGLGHSLLRHNKLFVTANAELQLLSTRHELNAYLGAIREDRAVYMLSVQSAGRVAIRSSPGETAALHSTSIGKVLLAHMDDAEAQRRLGASPLRRLAPATITDPARILAQLPRIRRDGYAIVKDENLLGVIAVGAPVHDVSGKVIAAISAAFAVNSPPGMTAKALVPLVVAAARRISIAQGWQPADGIQRAKWLLPQPARVET